MKQCLGILLNYFHTHSEPLELGASVRHQQLVGDLDLILEDSYNDLLNRLQVSDRVRIDLAHAFHFLPAPDCDVTSLFATTLSKLNDSNYVDRKVFDQFMNYSKSFDLTYYMRQRRRIPVTAGKPIHMTEFWVKKCFSGVPVMPPVLGETWIENEFRFECSKDVWHWECGDVTHVLADPAEYYTANRIVDISYVDHNELLYALIHAPLLTKKFHPKQVRSWLALPALQPECPAELPQVLAAKAEIRSPLERRAQHTQPLTLSEKLPVNLTGLPTVCAICTQRRCFARPKTPWPNESCPLSRPPKDIYNLIISLDVSGWSPNAMRETMFEHHHYVLRTCAIGQAYDITELWSRIKLLISKRGVFHEALGNKGMFQGFTGTMDTVFHVHMLYFCVYEAKRKHILSKSEAARAAALIDDAIISVPLDISRILVDAQQTADVFLDHVRDTYKQLGFILDISKTLYSTDKCVFLNRIYDGKSEVLTAMMVFSKISHEHRRRYVGSDEHVSSTGRCAVSRGADPIITYHYCALKGFLFLLPRLERNCKWTKEPLLVGALMPLDLGGLAFPTIAHWLTGIRRDPLSAFCALAVKLYRANPSAQVGRAFMAAACSMKTRDLANVNIWTVINISNPMHVSFDIPTRASVIAHNNKLRQSRFTKSPVFKDALSSNFSGDYNFILSEVMKGLRVDASVLNVLSLNCSLLRWCMH